MNKNSTEQKTSTFSITSKHFTQQIEVSLIKLIQCLSIEYQITPDPDAKNMARKIVQEKINQMLNDEEIEGVQAFKEAIKERLANGDEFARAAYEVLKMMGLDNV